MLDDEDASRRHGRFVRNYSGYQVADLATANGTFVNGERLDDPRQLESKDKIKIGEVQIDCSITKGYNSNGSPESWSI